jgi:two-component system NtrC family sensor kinase
VKSAPRKSVVIVDDDQFYLSLLQQLLGKNMDCAIEAFARPRDALAALPGLNAGLIVTDYEMPDLNGFEFMAEAAQVAPGVSFILITGLPISAAMERMVNTSPLKSILHKPFNWRTLADEIVRHWPESGAALLKANPTSA